MTSTKSILTGELGSLKLHRRDASLRHQASATSAVIGSVAGSRLVRKTKAKNNNSCITPTDLSAIQINDTISTLERYSAARMKLKDSLNHCRRKDWGSFEYPELDQLSECSEFSKFREQISKVLAGEKYSAVNGTSWIKFKSVVENIFRALVPFAQHVLTIAKSGQSVRILDHFSHSRFQF